MNDIPCEECGSPTEDGAPERPGLTLCPPCMESHARKPSVRESWSMVLTWPEWRAALANMRASNTTSFGFDVKG